MKPTIANMWRAKSHADTAQSAACQRDHVILRPAGGGR